MGNTLMKLMVEIGADTKGAVTGLRDVERSAKSTASSMLSSIKPSISSMLTLSSVIAGVGLAYEGTVGELIKYGDQVKQLQTITGQSAEETSRQIQLADDLRVSYESLSISLRTASKDGIDTSIEGLIKLGEEYKKLKPGMAQTEFLMKKFGRQGVEMGKILTQTSDQIRDLARNTPDGLILDDEDIKALEEYNKSLDALNDSFLNLKMTVAKDVVPSLTKLTDFFNDPSADTAADFINKVFEGTIIESAAHKAARLTAEIEDTGDAANQASIDLEGLEDPIKAAEEAAKKLSSALEASLSDMFSINAEREKFADDIKKNEQEAADLAEERTRTEYEFFLATQEHEQKLKDLQREINNASTAEEQRQAKEAYLHEQNKYIQEDTIRFYQQLQDLEKEQGKNVEDRAKIEKDKAEAQKKLIYDLTLERLKATGDILDSGEYEYATDLAVNLGLITQADADRAIQASKTATENVANFERERGGLALVNQELATFASYDGASINLAVNVDTSALNSALAGMGGLANPGGYSIPSNASSGGYTPINFGGTYQDKDSGGSGQAGTPYMIGTGAQPELFVPNTSGKFYPNANNGMGATYNIVVYNPKKETAEDSIRKSLKSLSYSGVVA